MCRECYAENNRITPLRGARECLEKHTQYICGTCGRCICIEKEPRRGLQRWNFPFGSIEDAKLYLRTAEYTRKRPCGIYKIESGTGRVAYKIFEGREELETFLRKNPGKLCQGMEPVFWTPVYKEFPRTQVRRLTEEEAAAYLRERDQSSTADKAGAGG